MRLGRCAQDAADVSDDVAKHAADRTYRRMLLVFGVSFLVLALAAGFLTHEVGLVVRSSSSLVIAMVSWPGVAGDGAHVLTNEHHG